MAITESISSVWSDNVGPQGKLTKFGGSGGLGVQLMEVAVTASTTYSTGGITVDLSDDGRFSKVLAAVVVDGQGFVAVYVPATGDAAATGKLKLYGEEQVSGATTPGPILNELAASSAAIQGKTFKILVFGR